MRRPSRRWMVLVAALVTSMVLSVWGWSRPDAEYPFVRTVVSSPDGAASVARGHAQMAKEWERKTSNPPSRVVEGSVGAVAEQALVRFEGRKWEIVLSEYLGLGTDRWAGVFREPNGREVAFVLAQRQEADPPSTKLTEVIIDVSAQARALGFSPHEP